jgi:hypothetical protein
MTKSLAHLPMVLYKRRFGDRLKIRIRRWLNREILWEYHTRTVHYAICNYNYFRMFRRLGNEPILYKTRFQGIPDWLRTEFKVVNIGKWIFFKREKGKYE